MRVGDDLDRDARIGRVGPIGERRSDVEQPHPDPIEHRQLRVVHASQPEHERMIERQHPRRDRVHPVDRQQYAPHLERGGRGPNSDAVIYVRGAQPVLVQNIFANSVLRTDDGGGIGNTAISINANSLNHFYVRDLGRQVGSNDRFMGVPDNQGPLVRGNQFDQDVGAGTIFSGMEIRGEELTTESVWDDTDITHFTFDQILVPDFHTFGGLRLESSATESLLVKLGGATSGFVATGSRIENDDRIGGRIQVVGQPGVPVILTSLADDSSGAGFNLNGTSITDISNNGTTVLPAPGDWGGIRLLDGSHDRNVEIVTDLDSATAVAPGTNATPCQCTIARRAGTQ